MENLNRGNNENSVAKHRLLIGMLQQTINEIIKDSMADFLMLSSLLKHFDHMVQHGEATDPSETLSKSVAALQRIDIFTQKLTHMSRLNEMAASEADIAATILQSEGRAHFCRFILRLNYLQSLAASYDYHSIIRSVRGNLNDLHSEIMKKPGITFSETQFFRHYDLIVTKLGLLTSGLSDLSSGWSKKNCEIDEYTRMGVLKIQEFYSIESERFVLQWLLTNPQGEESDLMDKYVNKLTIEMSAVDQKSDIELF